MMTEAETLAERLRAERRRKDERRARWEWAVFVVVAGVAAVVWWRWK
jgi:hypothetical protein